MKLDKRGGWQTGHVGHAGVVGIYHAPTIAEIQAVDMEILAKHPFVNFWSGENIECM